VGWRVEGGEEGVGVGVGVGLEEIVWRGMFGAKEDLVEMYN